GAGAVAGGWVAVWGSWGSRGDDAQAIAPRRKGSVMYRAALMGALITQRFRDARLLVGARTAWFPSSSHERVVEQASSYGAKRASTSCALCGACARRDRRRGPGLVRRPGV